LKSFFATAESAINRTWEDPAKCGPAVSAKMDKLKCAAAAKKFQETGQNIDRAIYCEKQGRVGDALNIWQKQVFGKMFPLS
jgi:hypothetical protein